MAEEFTGVDYTAAERPDSLSVVVSSSVDHDSTMSEYHAYTCNVGLFAVSEWELS